VFIQCVGSRIKERPYCSRVCCTHSTLSASKLKEIRPDREVYILYRDLRTYGFREQLYRHVREQGVHFIRYELEQGLSVAEEGGSLKVQFFDYVLQTRMELSPDLLVLATAIVPPEKNSLAQLFRVPLNEDGFFAEAHIKLRPVDFASDGLFMAGLAHYPKSIDESITQAKAAAARALTILSKEAIMVGGVVATVASEKCAACLTCVRTCPYNVPYIGEQGYAVIDPAGCQGCGACVAECPGKAITLQHFTDQQIIAKTDALFHIKEESHT
jgi:heterodisulfide reductase subunit A-like polyferredoxin